MCSITEIPILRSSTPGGDVNHQPSDSVDWQPAPQEFFTGSVWFGALHAPTDEMDINVLGVRFAPGARSDWHSHPGGQVLYVVEGTARVQTEGGDVIEAGPGDAVHAPAGELHWHGATPDGPMVHLSITHLGATEWEPRKVTDEEYGNAARSLGGAEGSSMAP